MRKSHFVQAAAAFLVAAGSITLPFVGIANADPVNTACVNMMQAVAASNGATVTAQAAGTFCQSLGAGVYTPGTAPATGSATCPVGKFDPNTGQACPASTTGTGNACSTQFDPNTGKACSTQNNVGAPLGSGNTGTSVPSTSVGAGITITNGLAPGGAPNLDSIQASGCGATKSDTGVYLQSGVNTTCSATLSGLPTDWVLVTDGINAKVNGAEHRNEIRIYPAPLGGSVQITLTDGAALIGPAARVNARFCSIKKTAAENNWALVAQAVPNGATC